LAKLEQKEHAEFSISVPTQQIDKPKYRCLWINHRWIPF